MENKSLWDMVTLIKTKHIISNDTGNQSLFLNLIKMLLSGIEY